VCNSLLLLTKTSVLSQTNKYLLLGEKLIMAMMATKRLQASLRKLNKFYHKKEAQKYLHHYMEITMLKVV